MLNKTLWALGAVAALCILSGPASALLITGSSGNLSASADFALVGGNLQVTLTNTSTADALVPTDVLTGVFFSIAGDPTLTSISAALASGSSVLFGTTNPGNVVGGEWAYKSNLSGAPGGANQGISSSGLGLFGAATFPGTNLQGPASVGGLQYGITSMGDNPVTGNTPMTGTNALIKYAVVFTLGGLPANFSLDDISNVSFQYGTSLTEPNVPGDPPTVVPEPASMTLVGLGIAAMALQRRLRRQVA